MNNDEDSLSVDVSVTESPYDGYDASNQESEMTIVSGGSSFKSFLSAKRSDLNESDDDLYMDLARVIKIVGSDSSTIAKPTGPESSTENGESSESGEVSSNDSADVPSEGDGDAEKMELIQSIVNVASEYAAEVYQPHYQIRVGPSREFKPMEVIVEENEVRHASPCRLYSRAARRVSARLEASAELIPERLNTEDWVKVSGGETTVRASDVVEKPTLCSKDSRVSVKMPWNVTGFVKSVSFSASTEKMSPKIKTDVEENVEGSELVGTSPVGLVEKGPEGAEFRESTPFRPVMMSETPEDDEVVIRVSPTPSMSRMTRLAASSPVAPVDVASRNPSKLSSSSSLTLPIRTPFPAKSPFDSDFTTTPASRNQPSILRYFEPDEEGAFIVTPTGCSVSEGAEAAAASPTLKSQSESAEASTELEVGEERRTGTLRTEDNEHDEDDDVGVEVDLDAFMDRSSQNWAREGSPPFRRNTVETANFETPENVAPKMGEEKRSSKRSSADMTVISDSRIEDPSSKSSRPVSRVKEVFFIEKISHQKGAENMESLTVENLVAKSEPDDFSPTEIAEDTAVGVKSSEEVAESSHGFRPQSRMIFRIKNIASVSDNKITKDATTSADSVTEPESSVSRPGSPYPSPYPFFKTQKKK